jgi:hypothetical protein
VRQRSMMRRMPLGVKSVQLLAASPGQRARSTVLIDLRSSLALDFKLSHAYRQEGTHAYWQEGKETEAGACRSRRLTSPPRRWAAAPASA